MVRRSPRAQDLSVCPIDVFVKVGAPSPVTPSQSHYVSPKPRPRQKPRPSPGKAPVAVAWVGFRRSRPGPVVVVVVGAGATHVSLFELLPATHPCPAFVT